MKAIIVSVNYGDYLSVTLPRNFHHFTEIVVVTTLDDTETQQVAYSVPNARCYCTDAFYDDGAQFNKYKALEQGIDELGRDGWLCVLDADVVWPKRIPDFEFVPGNLYTPERRMKADASVPPEIEWSRYPIYHLHWHWSGYSHIFHARDPVLGAPPWHDTKGAHAGGGDTWFQDKWSKDKKIRPLWTVLHLGPNRVNWRGRVSPRVEGVPCVN
jgi:hypothetical protein